MNDQEHLPEIPAESLRIIKTDPPISFEITTEGVQFFCQAEGGDVVFLVDINENQANEAEKPRTFLGKFTVASLEYKPTQRYFIYFEKTGTGAIYEKAYVPRKSKEVVSY